MIITLDADSIRWLNTMNTDDMALKGRGAAPTVSGYYGLMVMHQLRAMQKFLSGAANDKRKIRRVVYQFPNSNT